MQSDRSVDCKPNTVLSGLPSRRPPVQHQSICDVTGAVVADVTCAINTAPGNILCSRRPTVAVYKARSIIHSCDTGYNNAVRSTFQTSLEPPGGTRTRCHIRLALRYRLVTDNGIINYWFIHLELDCKWTWKETGYFGYRSVFPSRLIGGVV
jgi:hypothetical protein